jgi:hypothetical protein
VLVLNNFEVFIGGSTLTVSLLLAIVPLTFLAGWARAHSCLPLSGRNEGPRTRLRPVRFPGASPLVQSAPGNRSPTTPTKDGSCPSKHCPPTPWRLLVRTLCVTRSPCSLRTRS